MHRGSAVKVNKNLPPKLRGQVLGIACTVSYMLKSLTTKLRPGMCIRECLLEQLRIVIGQSH